MEFMSRRKPASFLLSEKAVAPATFDYKTRPILFPVANEPCVFMRFPIRLPDPGGPRLVVNWNLLNTT